eukprot:CAMPEP_0172512994 /NCGR_PEP_ID=MMETSP1066-20121228/248610_1 /TAXON_ID=671091 /ORGANISM="Coscinodiscus wailesii, Strain CCMP2513" /LENGTH=509 /DNA_ID=CAMNT_0013293045 /DNA_START=44 /DNA_END=1573 /DNA_ORIENTATION=+
MPTCPLMAQQGEGESLPLITHLECGMTSIEKSSHNEGPPSPESNATVEQTSWNITKTCMGTGTLALPYAASEGGIIFTIACIATISLWNAYTVDRLLRCLDFIESTNDENGGGEVLMTKRDKSNNDAKCYGGNDDRNEDEDAIVTGTIPPGTSTFGQVAWHAFGIKGLFAVDCAMLILLLGVIIAYQDAITSLMGNTPFSTNSSFGDAIVTLLIITPLSCIQNLTLLSRTSKLGIFILYFTFSVIYFYGFITRGDNNTTFDDKTVSYLPSRGLTGISACFGVIIFGYGATPLTYNFRECMTEPSKMMKATILALGFISITYTLFGVGVVMVFRGHVFDGDVLQVLPNGWMPVVVRLAMVFVVVVTVPLIVLPCAEIVEGLIVRGKGSFYAENIVTTRVGVCVFCTAFSVLVPNFVSVLSLIGCFCVALASLVFPPLFYVTLALRSKNRFYDDRNGQEWMKLLLKRTDLAFDIIMLVWGLFATMFSSFLTLKKMLSQTECETVGGLPGRE